MTHLAVFRALYGRVFALCHARDNPAHGDDLLFLVNITPAQSHDFFRTQAGKQHERDCGAERLVQMAEDSLDLVQRKNLHCAQRLVCGHAYRVTRVLTAQLILYSRFHDLVDGDINVMPGTLAQVGSDGKQFLKVFKTRSYLAALLHYRQGSYLLAIFLCFSYSSNDFNYTSNDPALLQISAFDALGLVFRVNRHNVDPVLAGLVVDSLERGFVVAEHDDTNATRMAYIRTTQAQNIISVEKLRVH